MKTTGTDPASVSRKTPALPMLGFGMMRLPKTAAGKIDRPLAAAMIDRAMKAGCNYFDTAYMYHEGESEVFAGDFLTAYPRESYILTSKMPTMRLKTAEDMERIFNEQLARTKAGYFDYYLMHTLTQELWKTAKDLDLYSFMKEKQKQGLIRHIGFSFHDTPELLKEIASAYPWDLAQIQLNYLDWEAYRSREQYEILAERKIPVAVMEPLKGGALAELTPEAKNVFQSASPASYGLRFAASLPEVKIVLSGMSTPEQLEDNIRTFTPFVPLTEEEYGLIAEALLRYNLSNLIPCTACRYCMPCPANVNIPETIARLNRARLGFAAENTATPCVRCGACLPKCPQKINIPAMLASE